MFLNIKLTSCFPHFGLIPHNLSSVLFLNYPQLYSISTDASLRMPFPVTHQIPSRVNMHLLSWQVIAVHVILWVLSSFSLRCSLHKLQGFGYFGHMLFRRRYVVFIFVLGSSVYYILIGHVGICCYAWSTF